MSDVFSSVEGQTPVSSASNDVPSLDVFANQLMDIKNERGEPKYDSLSKALDALKHSQEYIPQLKSQNEQLLADLARYKEELTKREAVEDVVQRLSNRPPEVPKPTSEAPKGLDEAAVEAMLQRTLGEREKQQVANANMQAVHSALTAKFGDKAQEVVRAKAVELGMTPEALGELAKTSPKAVLSWFNTSPPAPSGAPVRTSVHLPAHQEDPSIQRPTKSLLRGATSKEQAEFMRKIKEDVYKKNGIDF